MKVFMLGWEFPPHISGGLGTACYGMTKGLDEIGVKVCFVLPTAVPIDTASHVQFRSPTNLPAVGKPDSGESGEFEHVSVRHVKAALQAYATPAGFEQAITKMVARQREMAIASRGGKAVTKERRMAPLPSGTFDGGAGAHYGGDLMGQVHRYARLAVELAESEEFDVVHAHDWMTYPAGVAVSAATDRPLVVHVHSTEFDRSGENINRQVYMIERNGMHNADKVVCVSYLTRNVAISRYDVPPQKIEVVYNAVDLPNNTELAMVPIRQNEKIVLFLGRVTMQKGPEYFLQAAKKVIQKYPNVRFVMAGSGDKITHCVKMAADLKIGGYVTFTGFLRGADVDRIFQMADLYVMPSVSEPFGIAPLEALSHNVPVIISKQSGVSEVLTHALKVDFWDVDEMANKILAVLRHPPLRKALRQQGHIELKKFSWTDSAKRLREIYDSVAVGGA